MPYEWCCDSPYSRQTVSQARTWKTYGPWGWSSSEVGGGPERTLHSIKRRIMVRFGELCGLNTIREGHVHVSIGSASSSGGVERAALTLAEKHADLLHAIAAIESKHPELTGGLGVVEGELGDLQRQWEQIVNCEPHYHTFPFPNPRASPLS
ncbi:uncharacterized protein EDB91DRAFT_1084398 [Suillus paluster]|uniref:uncharacterized protein n=1 Tax=Suillus paluster TaxID=48578 RepID=UPI001B863AAD|nr:uncharacterized protein EDB91DRAFT_1084398 [Suillus paluster]KAG1733332.1 hypothetical protein EDB91DRAFT_1084398 [Suillus paluster]